MDEAACERLIVEYTHLVDFGNAPGIADLFTSDGVWRGYGHKLKQLASTAIGFFVNTRWSRTLHLIR